MRTNQNNQILPEVPFLCLIQPVHSSHEGRPIQHRPSPITYNERTLKIFPMPPARKKVKNKQTSRSTDNKKKGEANIYGVFGVGMDLEGGAVERLHEDLHAPRSGLLTNSMNETYLQDKDGIGGGDG